MNKKTEKLADKDLQYLQLLSKTFPTVADASTEIINLQAILNLPKGTEHFLADIHGSYESFQHVLKNASGNIKRKVNEIFGNQIRETELRELCTLIYYPEQKLEQIKPKEENLSDWYHITIHQLVTVCREVSSKYTRSKVRKSLPKEFSYIIQELLHERTDDIDKAGYVNAVVDSMIETDRADDFIITISFPYYLLGLCCLSMRSTLAIRCSLLPAKTLGLYRIVICMTALPLFTSAYSPPEIANVK